MLPVQPRPHFLKLIWTGQNPLKMKDGTRIGFGEVSKELLPIYNQKKEINKILQINSLTPNK